MGKCSNPGCNNDCKYLFCGRDDCSVRRVQAQPQPQQWQPQPQVVYVQEPSLWPRSMWHMTRNINPFPSLFAPETTVISDGHTTMVIRCEWCGSEIARNAIKYVLIAGVLKKLCAACAGGD